MDFLKKLSINDDESKSAHNAASAHPATAPGPVPAAEHQHHSTHSLLDKLSATLNPADKHSTPTPPPPPVAPPKNDSVFDKIGDALGHVHHSSPPPPPLPAPAKEEQGLMDKILELGGHHAPAPPPPPPVAPKEEGLLDKIGNAFGGHNTSPPPPPKKEEGLLGKIGEVVGHGRHEEPKKPETLGDKINSALGGGRKGEEQEDMLDKAIDFVQEHVLWQGQQKDETAVEQLKDKQIAAAIKAGFKNVTGKEFPSHNEKT